MELAASVGLAAKDFVKAVGPVNTQESHHREEDADTGTSGTFHVKGIEVLQVIPGVTSFEEGEAIDIGGVAKNERITQFQREAVIGVTCVASRCVTIEK